MSETTKRRNPNAFQRIPQREIDEEMAKFYAQRRRTKLREAGIAMGILVAAILYAGLTLWMLWPKAH